MVLGADRSCKVGWKIRHADRQSDSASSPQPRINRKRYWTSRNNLLQASVFRLIRESRQCLYFLRYVYCLTYSSWNMWVHWATCTAGIIPSIFPTNSTFDTFFHILNFFPPHTHGLIFPQNLLAWFSYFTCLLSLLVDLCGNETTWLYMIRSFASYFSFRIQIYSPSFIPCMYCICAKAQMMYNQVKK